MTINLKNFLKDKPKLSKMGEFQELQEIDGLEVSAVSADLYGSGRDDLALFYFKDGANYVAIGAFFKSNTKKVYYIAKPSLISWAKRFTKLPVLIIGGITNKNFRKLLLHKPDYLANSGGIWNKKPAKAIREFL